jgi:hypothetical protein
LAVFLGVALVFWLLVAIPARHWWGDTEAVYSAVALAICVLPAAATLAWSSWVVHRPPAQQLVAVLGGTAVRLAVVSGLALALYQRLEYFHKEPSFWGWVLVFYLFTLALEMTLLLAGRPVAPNGP